jgi:hypothetical protein
MASMSSARKLRRNDVVVSTREASSDAAKGMRTVANED